METLKPMMCSCCNLEINDDFLSHKMSSTHLFNFYIWAYDKKRKALSKDKDGMRLEIDPINVKKGSLRFDYIKKRGKYFIEIGPSQLHANNNILEFRCCLYNERKDDDIYLTDAKILDASPWSSCYDDKEEWIKSKRFIKIKPKEKYNGVVIKFQIDQTILGSFKVPFAFNLQTEDGKTNLTFCRTFVISVTDCKEKEEELERKHHSPFTDQRWDRSVKIIPAVRYVNILRNYMIPAMYNKCFRYGLKTWKGISAAENNILHGLRKQMEPGSVTKQNYQKFFHNCLWLEEEVNAMMLRCFNMENVTMTVQESTNLKLEVPGLAEKRPSLIAGDLIYVRIHDDHTGYEGYVKSVEDRHIIIQYIDAEVVDTVYSCPDTELDVAFQLGRLPLERAHNGIDKVCAKGLLNFLFPDQRKLPSTVQISKLQDKDFLNKDIIYNAEQRTAVEKILNGSSQGIPYIVFGPPGTGKTVTIVEAICQILKKTKKRILVCAPANAACDMLTEKLLEYCSRKELIRIHSDSRDRSTISKRVMDCSNMTSDGKILAMDESHLLSYRIVVTTLIFIGRFGKGIYKPDFLFIDEAAQAMEPDCCVALGMMKAGDNIVLAGDPQQLGPIVQSTIVKEYGLDTSLLERLMNTQKTYQNENPNFITMLKKNFRTHPDILEIPNRRFYDSKLEAVSKQPLLDPVAKMDVYQNISKFLPSHKAAKTKANVEPGRAMEFCAVSAKEQREGRSPSFFNPAEANMVIKYIKSLIGSQLGSSSAVTPSDIGVITPYIRQVYKIKGLLQANNFKDVEVGSTEAFQGREKRIIIISTVRAQHDLLKHDKKYALGFVKQEKRFNVAVTRAKSKLIVIGCPTVLATDEKWREYMEQCVDLKSYHGPPVQLRTDEKMTEIIDRFAGFPKFSTKADER